MPRQVDYGSRRRQVAAAVRELARESGLEAVTLRDVAQRAGVSMGAVQRCFRTKDEMLVFALTDVSEGVTARVRAAAAEPPGAALARTAVEVALLGGEERIQEAYVWLAFVARAAVSPGLAEVLRGGYTEIHPVLVRLIDGATGGAADAEREARALLALADGLTTHVLLGHLGRVEALAVLDGWLAALTGGQAPRQPSARSGR